MHRLWLALTLASLVSGCVTSEDRAAAVIAADDDACRSYGAQPWTPVYLRCRVAMDRQREAVAATLAGIDIYGPPPPPVGPGPHVVLMERY